jgi:hypothetical protein
LYHFMGSARAMLLSLGSAACSFVVPNAMSSNGLSARVARVCGQEDNRGQMRQANVESLITRLSGLFVYRDQQRDPAGRERPH